MQAAFYGVGAAVIAIIVRAAYKLTRLTIGGNRLLWVIFAIMTVVTAWTESEIATLFILCVLAALVWFFTKAGAFVFGSGLAIVPFLYGGVVQQHGWLTDQQFLDAVAVALITPGPVVITTGFIGYLLAGLPGAIVASVATFLPAYLLTIIP